MKIDKRAARVWSMMGPTGLFGVAMHELAKENKDFCVVTADLCSFSGLERFSQEFPENFYNVGIAEQNMVGVAAGLAHEGMNVFAATYASFASTRALDQVRISMGYMNLPIKLVGLTAGFASGILGATHMSLEDLAVMRAIPNIVILSPADCAETIKCLEAAMDYAGPVYIRLTGGARMPIVYQEDYEYRIGVPIQLKEGDEVCILATGSMVNTALETGKELDGLGISTAVIDVHTIKPFEGAIPENVMKYKLIVTAEEHSVTGGLGSAVGEVLSGYQEHPPLLRIGTRGQYPHGASYPFLMEKSGLIKEKMIETIMDRIK